MAMTTIPWNLLGFRVMGDLGGFTIYTDRFYRKVWYPRAPPHKPPSAAQRHFRARFKAAVAAWKSLSDSDKAALERAVHTLSLCLTGQNLFTSCALRSAFEAYETIGRQSSEVLPPLPVIP
jgi:hypothetical protein